MCIWIRHFAKAHAAITTFNFGFNIENKVENCRIDRKDAS